MHEGRAVFSQVIDFLPRHTFRRRVERYGGDHGVRGYCQILCMAGSAQAAILSSRTPSMKRTSRMTSATSL